jgi:hypothetical protein
VKELIYVICGGEKEIMTNTYEPKSENEYELIGRITGLGDQVVIYYNHTTLRVEVYTQKLEDSMIKIVKLEKNQQLETMIKYVTDK